MQKLNKEFFQRAQKTFSFLRIRRLWLRNEKEANKKISKSLKRVKKKNLALEIYISQGNSGNLIAISSYLSDSLGKKLNEDYKLSVRRIDIKYGHLTSNEKLRPVKRPVKPLTDNNNDVVIDITMNNKTLKVVISIYNNNTNITELIEFQNVALLSLQNEITCEYLSFEKGADKLRLQEKYTPLIFTKKILENQNQN